MSTTPSLRSLSDPFDQLLALEDRLRAVRLDLAAGQAQVWIGLGFRMGDLWLVAPQADVREVAGYRQFTPTEQKPERVADGGLYAPYVLGAFERDGRGWLALSLQKLVRSDTFQDAGL